MKVGEGLITFDLSREMILARRKHWLNPAAGGRTGAVCKDIRAGSRSNCKNLPSVAQLPGFLSR